MEKSEYPIRQQLERELGTEYFEQLIAYNLDTSKTSFENQEWYGMAKKRISIISTAIGLAIIALYAKEEISAECMIVSNSINLGSCFVLNKYIFTVERDCSYDDYCQKFEFVRDKVPERCNLLLNATYEEMGVPLSHQYPSPKETTTKEVIKSVVKESLEKIIPFLGSLLA